MELRSPSINSDEELTPIQEFYSGCNIFITGATGFFGKMLLHKLLVSCPGIETIYCLVRNKKGKDIHSRIEEIFEDQMFSVMKEKVPKFRHHIQGIAGDCMLPGLGISSSDRQSLINNVNIVFHMAATVKFDEKLKIAMQINVLACKDILVLSKEMKNLKILMHVSTAYTNCPQKKIEEKFYPPPMDSEKIIMIAESSSEKLLDSITTILLDQWPNTYAFTKAIAEDVVRQNSKGMPVGIYRPGIVISSYKEPFSGWIDNYYGPTGVIAGAGTGVIRSLRCDPKVDANMVPIDMCVNGMIAAAWDVARQYKLNITQEPNIPIYNYCTAKENSITWHQFSTVTTTYGLAAPTMKAIWYLSYRNNPNKFAHMISVWFMHYIPAVIFDGVALIIGKKPRLLTTYSKIHRFMNVISYFALRDWDFSITNTTKLYDSLTEKEKKIFFFDMKLLNWDNYLKDYFHGVRKFLLNDPIETIPAAIIRWNRLYWIHQAFKLFLTAVSLRVVWSFFKLFFK